MTPSTDGATAGFSTCHQPVPASNSLGTREDQIVGGRLLLAVHLRGELRNVGLGRDNRLRAGIEFVDLTDGERAYLDSLAELQVAW